MKKIILISMFLIAYAGYAQEESFKPEKGDFTVELQFAPFGLSISEYEGVETFAPFKINGLRARYFVNEKWAIRMNLLIDYSTQKDDYTESGDNIYSSSLQGVSTGEITQHLFLSTMNYRIAPGFEYHFGKAKKLSFYTGAELFFGGARHKMKEEREEHLLENYSGNTLDHSAVLKLNALGYSTVWPGKRNRITPSGVSNINLGINAFLGADFYVYKGLYLGAELGIGYSYSFDLKAKVEGVYEYTIKDYVGTVIESEKKDYEIGTIERKIASSNFAFYCEPRIRLGFKF